MSDSIQLGVVELNDAEIDSVAGGATAASAAGTYVSTTSAQWSYTEARTYATLTFSGFAANSSSAAGAGY